jgi:predicted RNA-binding Zn ribbon-like protein
MTAPDAAGPEFVCLGDALWLDFVNTARSRTSPALDRLADAAAWRRWLEVQHLPTADADARLAAAHLLRGRLLALAEALLHGRPAPIPAIEALNGLLAERAGSQRLTRLAGAWSLDFHPAAPAGPLAAIAHSAAATLADPFVLVRGCAADECSLLFLEPAGGPRRHWCSADACGRHRRVERRRGALR